MRTIGGVITRLPIFDDLQRLTEREPFTTQRVLNQDSGLCQGQRRGFFF